MEDRYREAEGQLDLFPEAIKPKLTWRYVPWAIVLVVFVLLALPSAMAQEHRHPPEHAQLHDQFYSKWKRPDNPKASCCGGQDCFPVEIKHEGGSLYVKSRWDGSWVLMPPEKIDRRNVSPDGQNHACLSPPTFEGGVQYEGNQPLCFMYGAGT